MQEFRLGSVEANGLTFRFLEAGDGPLVLCLHGFPDHARSFRHQLPALAAAGYRTVAPYMRGYAPTDVPPNGPYHAGVLVQDALALIDALGYESAVLFGHDWGAIAGYGAAMGAPNKVQKLVTAAVPLRPAFLNAFLVSPLQPLRSWYVAFFQLPLAEVALASNDYALIESLWRAWSPGWVYPAEEMASLKETFRKPGVARAAIDYYRHTLNPAFQTPALSAIQARLATEPVPVATLYFHGAGDGVAGLELTVGMEPRFPRGLRREIIPGAGHFVHQAQPDAVNAILLDFLRS